MTRLLVGTDSVATSERLAEYVRDVVDETDSVVLVNSLIGGEETTREMVEEGTDALDALEAAIPEETEVIRHQYIRGNEPSEDLLVAADEFDVDEILIGLRKKSPLGQLILGSTGRNILFDSERPIRCVPLDPPRRLLVFSGERSPLAGLHSYLRSSL